MDESDITTPTSPESRRQAAAEALAALGVQRSEHQALSVQCPRSHHLAAVYKTDAGLVYHAIEGPHAHGSRDRVDTGHHGTPSGTEYVDFLAGDSLSDDGLPAWCDCGPYTLSRSELLEAAAGPPRTLHVP
jgi:hypothetical protein